VNTNTFYLVLDTMCGGIRARVSVVVLSRPRFP
jgi:hypothetical protein